MDKIKFKKFFRKYLRIILNIIFFILTILTISTPQGRFGRGLKEGSISPYDLYSPLDTVVKTEIDEERTKREKQKAREGVRDIYDYDRIKLEERITFLQNIFSQLIAFKNSSQGEETQKAEIARRFSLSLSVVKTLLQIEDLSRAEKEFQELFSQFLNQPILPSSLREELLKLNKTKILIRDIEKNTITEAETLSLPVPEEITRKMEEYLNNRKSPLMMNREIRSLLEMIVEPNLFYNQEITFRFKTEAEERVRPFYKEVDIKKNELILAKGQRITLREMRIIEQINREMGKLNVVYTALSAGILLIFLFTLAGFYIHHYEPEVYRHLNELIFVEFLFLISLLVTRWGYFSGLNPFLLPLPATAMLFSLLLGGRIAIKIYIFLTLVTAFILEFNFKYILVFLIAGTMGALLVERTRRRSQILTSGVGVGVGEFISIFAIGLGEQLNLLDLVKEASWGFSNGIISAFITLGSLSFFEYLFQLTSNITLLELSDTNHPLLKELILKAPGTYHHSLIVGNLAETACAAIGANSLLARVGAYYHDIGKIEKSEYFSENQPPSRSKHIRLTPELSSLVIINHIKKGVEKAKKHRLNRKITEIIAQHHGTSKVYYFYQQALLREKEEKEIDTTRFHYPGPLPQTKEAGVVLLADSVEAASRAIIEPNPVSIRNLVKKIINDKFVDGQLNECNLTLQDLNKISECFIKILLGIFHTRIKYPEMERDENRGNQAHKKENTLLASGDKE
ncbi:MAG: HDIG domain-containing protein [Candidatus Omnitrophica bacterium]|nr:HDIG domain-containing protein [Candidatus Omnitrophota bacterium]MCM8792903.1 HDIG domain-containing protein [Candidatus Omnitrophota bacterium]